MAAPPDTNPSPVPLPPKRLLKRRDVAELAQLSERTIERLDAEGEGPPRIRIGRSVRYEPGDIALWIQSRRRA
jgi:predicted DNA-binding transcriptional regulator AlpA